MAKYTYTQTSDLMERNKRLERHLYETAEENKQLQQQVKELEGIASKLRRRIKQVEKGTAA